MTIRGSCHCGATRFEIAEAPASVTSCTCTNCAKRGALWAYYRPAEVRFVSDAAMAITSGGPRIGKYNFYSRCGNNTYSETPDWSTGGTDSDNPRIAINARLLDDVDLKTIAIEVIDGRNLW